MISLKKFGRIKLSVTINKYVQQIILHINGNQVDKKEMVKQLTIHLQLSRN